MSELFRLEEVGLEVTSPVPTRILHPVSLTVDRSSRVAVVGPSGAGKTTLASIVGGLQSASEGAYTFSGSRIDRLNTRRMACFRRDHVGFVFQNAHLIDERSAWQNVALGITDLTIDRGEVEARSRAALVEVGLGDIPDRLATLLSGGERQRVAVARALAKRPELIIADEPTGSLDQATGRAILDLIFGLETTVLLVTHDMRAAELTDRVVTIVDGRIASPR